MSAVMIAFGSRSIIHSSLLRWSRGVLVVVLLFAGSLAAPAAAATEPIAFPTRGYVALYGSQLPASVLVVTYTACTPPVQRWLSAVATSFTNLPLPECQVLVVNDKGERFTLCEGRGTIPPAFRQIRHLLIQPGETRPCLV